MRPPVHAAAVLLAAISLGWQPALAAGKNSAKRGKPVEITVKKPRRNAVDAFLTIRPGELAKIRRAFQLNAQSRILPPFLGDGLTRPGKTISLATQGTATYQKNFPPILVGDSAGQRQIEPTVDIKATFQDGQSSVHGRMSFAQSKPAGGEIPGAFGMVRFNSGSAASGATYSGAFYGANAAETAGVFQFLPNNTTTSSSPAPESALKLQGVGAFGASR